MVLNLRFDSDFTRRLGLENHVCEVQLVHAAFAAVVKAGSHRQYTDFRDLRGHVRPAFAAPARAGTVHPVAPAAVAAMLSALMQSSQDEEDLERGGSSRIASRSSGWGGGREEERKGVGAVRASPDVARGIESASFSSEELKQSQRLRVASASMSAWLSETLRRVPSDSIDGVEPVAGAGHPGGAGHSRAEGPIGLSLNSMSGDQQRWGRQRVSDSEGSASTSAVRPFDEARSEGNLCAPPTILRRRRGCRR